MTEEKPQIIKGSGNPFRDVDLSDPNTRLVKADLATVIIRAQQEKGLTNAAGRSITEIKNILEMAI